jgi:hypothetical protein
MKITLRKANALQTAIQDHIKTIEVKTSVSLNEFQVPQTELSAARDTLITNDTRRNQLTKALYAIRAKVGFANATNGVSDLLTQAAYIDKRIGYVKGLVESDAVEDEVVINGKLDKIRNDKSDNRRSIYGYNDTVTTGVLTADQISGFRQEMLSLKKEKQGINDKVLELNVRTEIELDDDTVTLLQAEQLV